MSERPLTETELRKVLALQVGRKSIVIALILWFFLGALGVHRLYLGKTASGVTMAVLTILGWITLPILIGAPILLAVFVWWVIDFIVIIVAATKHNQVHDTLNGG